MFTVAVVEIPLNCTQEILFTNVNYLFAAGGLSVNNLSWLLSGVRH